MQKTNFNAIIENYNKQHKDSIISVPRNNMEIYKTYLYLQNTMTNSELKDLENIELPKPKTLKELEIYRDCVDFYTDIKKVFEYKKGEPIYIDEDFKKIINKLIYYNDIDWGYNGETISDEEYDKLLNNPLESTLLITEEKIKKVQSIDRLYHKWTLHLQSVSYMLTQLFCYIYAPNKLSPSNLTEMENISYLSLEKYFKQDISKKVYIVDLYSSDVYLKGEKRSFYNTHTIREREGYMCIEEGGLVE